MAQDNNPIGFDWDAYERGKFGLTDEYKKGQIKVLQERISLYRRKISQIEQQKIKINQIRPQKKGRKICMWEKRISRYTDTINNLLRKIKELEDTM